MKKTKILSSIFIAGIVLTGCTQNGDAASTESKKAASQSSQKTTINHDDYDQVQAAKKEEKKKDSNKSKSKKESSKKSAAKKKSSSKKESSKKSAAKKKSTSKKKSTKKAVAKKKSASKKKSTKKAVAKKKNTSKKKNTKKAVAKKKNTSKKKNTKKAVAKKKNTSKKKNTNKSVAKNQPKKAAPAPVKTSGTDSGTTSKINSAIALDYNGKKAKEFDSLLSKLAKGQISASAAQSEIKSIKSWNEKYDGHNAEYEIAENVQAYTFETKSNDQSTIISEMQKHGFPSNHKYRKTSVYYNASTGKYNVAVIGVGFYYFVF
ncbi:hypothetical protein ACR6EC_22995 [Bacillus subtilis]|uniref:hypothetical protein n=1 Tax=Bacillus subtilis TaxID=1423 RepID=UPI003EB7A8C9